MNLARIQETTTNRPKTLRNPDPVREIEIKLTSYLMSVVGENMKRIEMIKKYLRTILLYPYILTKKLF